MEVNEGLSKWIETVLEKMPKLSKAQAVVLAMWSFGIVMTNKCGLTTVSTFMASLLGQKENTVRQRLREWYKDEEDKKGVQRREIEVKGNFKDIVGWVLSGWTALEKRIAIVLDASTLGQKFTVLAISIVYRGCAIPVAWEIVSATAKGEWQKHWLEMLNELDKSIPPDWTVIVMADRGLYAKWLFKKIAKMGWHPFLRINKNGTYRPQGKAQFRSLALVAPTVGSAWSGEVVCFKTNPLKCTLLARWDEGHEEAWLIVTNLLAHQADAFWYAMRPWIECGFKHTKRGGWQWQKTRMTDPGRASRLWLALAVATLWVVSVGSEAEDNLPASSFEQLPAAHIARRLVSNLPQPRFISCFQRGILTILAALLNGQPLPLGRFHPGPWPTSPPS